MYNCVVIDVCCCDVSVELAARELAAVVWNIVKIIVGVIFYEYVHLHVVCSVFCALFDTNYSRCSQRVDDNDDELSDLNMAGLLRLRGHKAVIEESHSSQCIAEFMNSCKTEQKAQFPVCCRKLSVVAMPELTRQTVPSRWCSCWEGTVTDGSTRGAWSDEC